MALIGPGGRPVTSGTGTEPAAGGSNSPYIKDSSLETFAADVLEAMGTGRGTAAERAADAVLRIARG